MIEIRELRVGDHESVIEMNNAAVPAVNPHEVASFAQLIDLSERAWVAVDDEGALGGVLVTMGPQAAYASRNYAWLRSRFDNFGYVDRIIASPTHRRMGIAGSLYATFAVHARTQGWDRLVCEVNVDPPNPQSIAFHQANGWSAIDDVTHEPGYTVRFFERLL